MKTYLTAHEQGYSLSIEKSEREEGYVSIQILYCDSPDGAASSTTISLKTTELAAALKAFL